MGGGSYEPVSISKSLTLKGANSSQTILDAESPGGHCDVIWIRASDVTIEGITVKNGTFGIRISSSIALSNISFKDVIVTSNSASGIVFDNGAGTCSVNNITFTDCKVENNGNRGIYFAPNTSANNVSLINTSCNNNKIMGFNCQGVIDGLTISGGTFNYNAGGSPEGTTEGPYYGFGISIENCKNVTINDVTAQYNGTGGLLLEGGAGIVVKKDSQNVVITAAQLTCNPIGLWLEPKWGAEDPTPEDVSIHFSTINGNTLYGVKNDIVTTEVNAINNWWGYNSGPCHPDDNPDGEGDSVSDDVNFDPWIGSELLDVGVLSGDNDSFENGEAGIGVEVGFEQGEGTVMVGVLEENPTEFESFEGSYFDVFIPEEQSEDIKQVVIKLYYKGGSAKEAYWYNGTTWVPCSNQRIVEDEVVVERVSYAGYVEVTINNDTTPSLSDLTGTVLGLADEIYKGNLTVTIQPEGARTAGGQWSIDGGENWNDSGQTLELNAGLYTITSKNINTGSWIIPEKQVVTIEKDENKEVTATYVKLGDIDADGDIDISDVMLALRMTVRLSVTIGEVEYPSPYPQWLILRADYNEDEALDIADVMLILRKTIGL